MKAWQAIPTWDGIFDASEDGEIRGLHRVVRRSNGWPKTCRGGILSQRLNRKTGYLTVTLFEPGRRETWTVHRLIAFTFLGPCPEGHEVAHWDADKQNNRITNLRYTTRVGNMADRRRHGQIRVGEQHPGAKLTADQVRAIRSTDGRQDHIAASFGVSPSLVSQIKLGKIWRHV